MSEGDERPGSVRGLMSGLWRFLDALRRFVFNLLFLAILIALVVAPFVGRPKVPATAALVIDPKGAIVEQLSASPRERLLGSLGLGGGGGPETLLKDLLDAIRAGKDDPRVKVLFLDLDEMGGAGLSKLQDLRRAVAEFKKSGKKVLAAADGYTQPQYYLAAQADEVFLNPQGLVLLEGYGGYRQHYKEGLDRFGIEVHVFKVGEYKSAVEPFTRKDMSPETKESLVDVFGDLWRSYLADVAPARKLKPEDITAGINSLPARLKEAGGDMARLALNAKLVDTLATRDEVRKRLVALVGEDKKAKSYNRISFRDYLEAKGGDRSGQKGGDAVAVIVAKGTILDGRQPSGRIGGDSTAALIKKAREDDKAKAVVLRVDSPGGSAFASEIIRRELELVQQAGKPVVVSMGSLAASGGYWISTASDEIWASPNTITGSIGIFGLFTTFEKPLAKYLGVHVDGVGTTPFTGALRPDRPLDATVAEVVQMSVSHGYEEFLARVGKARKMTREQVDKIARGRIWSGEDAKALGLVDQLGGLPEAVESAAKRAKLAAGYRVWWVEKEPTLRDRVLEGLFRSASRLAGLVDGGIEEERHARASPAERATRGLSEDLADLARWNDPKGLYAHCQCGDE